LFVGTYSKKLFPVWNWPTIYQLKDLVITKSWNGLSRSANLIDNFLSYLSKNDGRRYLPVHDICHIQGPLVCKLLPVVHALTGCDTTSSFFGIGKKTVLKTLKDNIDEFADLNKLCLFDSETSIDVSRYFVAT
jgi:hypothetical protein